MWAFEFAKKDTRYKVTKLKTFLLVNHDLSKMWLEETYFPKEIRSNFLLRVLRLYTYFNFFVIVVWFLMNFKDSDYLSECGLRED